MVQQGSGQEVIYKPEEANALETAPSGRHSKPRSESLQEPVDTVPEVLEEMRSAVIREPSTKGIIIRELEMLPRLEEMNQMEEIPVGGITNVGPEVVGAIAGVAAQAVEGVASLGATSLRRTLNERLGNAERQARGVGVEVGRREAIVDINLRVVHGYSIPKIVVEVRYRVADSLLRYAGLVVKDINIRVVGMEFPAKAPGRLD